MASCSFNCISGMDGGAGTMTAFLLTTAGSRGGGSALPVGAAGASSVVKEGRASVGGGAILGAFTGSGGTFDLYNFAIALPKAIFSSGIEGGGGTIIEFLFSTAGSIGGAEL